MTAGSLTLRFDAESHPDPEQRVAAWREAMSLSVDVAFRQEEAEAFGGRLDFHTLGSVVLIEARSSAHTVIRDRQTITRSGDGHIIFDYFSEGGFTGTVGGRPVEIGSGECFVMDLRGTMRVHLAAHRYIGVVIPRALLRRQAVGDVASFHGMRLPADSAEAKLLGASLEGFAAQAPYLLPARAAALGQCLVSLIGTAVGMTTRNPVWEAPAAPGADLARIRRHIERHAADPGLDPDALARTFGLSRATLYRLFKPVGGVADEIRRQRAAIARRLLTDTVSPDSTVIDIARASGFTDVRSLTRALREFYEATPAQLREAPGDVAPTGIAARIGKMFDAPQ